jgi:hypothetical protein
MNRLLRGTVAAAGTLALAGGAALAAAAPSGAAVRPAAPSAASRSGHHAMPGFKIHGNGRDNSSYGASATAGPITSPPLAEASSAGPTSVVAPNVSIPPLLTTTTTYDTATTTQAFSRVNNVHVSDSAGGESISLTASQVMSSCRSGTLLGTASIDSGVLTVDGVILHLPQHPAIDQTFPLDGGADGTLILNHQVTSAGHVTVHAVDLTYTPTSPDQTLTIASSACTNPSTLGNTVTVNTISAQSDVSGTPIADLTVTGTDSDHGEALDFSDGGTLPPGLTITDSTTNLQQAIISGTPTTAGVYTVTITATDSTGASGSTTFTWTITNTVTVDPATLSGVVGTAFSHQLTATDSDSSITTFVWTQTGGTLPTGLTLSAGGLISGTPSTATGSPFTATVRATDADGFFGSASVTITITSPNAITVVNPGPQSHASGSAISTLTITVNDSAAVPPGTITCSQTGMPTGLAFNTGTCAFTGTPTTPGVYTVTVRGTDSTGATNTTTFTWTIT